jgi:hypothetical protein
VVGDEFKGLIDGKNWIVMVYRLGRDLHRGWGCSQSG